MKRYLVTGGAGFLGSHLCKRLLDDGYKVMCIDNLSTGSLTNINDILFNEHFEFIERDVTLDLPQIGKIDGIFNLACPASPKQYQLNAVNTIRTNVLGAINMLDLAKRYRVPILQTSTSEVYGDPDRDILSEDYHGNVNPIGIRACYDEGKRVVETLFMDYHRQFNVDTRIVRIFNTYGPNMAMDDGRVVSNFIVQSLSRKPITIYGDGSQTRSFCYVSDMIEAIVRAFNTNYHLPINIGNPDERTILEISKLIQKKVGVDLENVYIDLPQDDPKKRFPDISLAKRLMNWEPCVSLEVGLDYTIEYFENIMKGTT